MPTQPEDDADSPVAAGRADTGGPNPLTILAVVGGAAVTAIVVVLVLGLTVFNWFDDPAATSSRSTPAPFTPPTYSEGTSEDSVELPAGQLPEFTAPPTPTNCVYTATMGQASGSASPPTGGQPGESAETPATITTDQGTIGVTLDAEKAPCTVHSFVSLAQQGYYDNTPCHRITTAESFGVLQCGDPTGLGNGGPGYQFADEYPVNQYMTGDYSSSMPVTYPRGTIAMANAGPGTNGSQFFLVYRDTEIQPAYTVFGTIDEAGLATLDTIAEAGTADGAEDGSPAVPVTVTSVQVG